MSNDTKLTINPALFGDVKAIAVETARLLVEDMEESAKSKHPFVEQSGDLEDSIESEGIADGGVFRVDSKYASYVEYGHIAADGSIVPARPFVRPAIKRAMSTANVHKRWLAIAQRKGF